MHDEARKNFFEPIPIRHLFDFLSFEPVECRCQNLAQNEPISGSVCSLNEKMVGNFTLKGSGCDPEKDSVKNLPG